MADFKTHLSVGIILGVACSAGATIIHIFSGISMFSLTVIAVAVGSLLPDLDSDSALPFKIVFYLFGIISSIITFLWSLNNYPEDWLFLIGLPLISFIAVRFILGRIFQKFTHHRGIFHSIPMAIVSILGTLTILKKIPNFTNTEITILSTAIGIGFLSHLILDEIYAAVNFNGKKFRPSKSLGSALKFWSKSPPITLLVYFIILILFVINF